MQFDSTATLERFKENVDKKYTTPAPSFIDQCLSGQCYVDDIDVFVELWHTSEDGHGLPLHEYLGFTKEEYPRWMMDPTALEDILQERLALNPISF